MIVRSGTPPWCGPPDAGHRLTEERVAPLRRTLSSDVGFAAALALATLLLPSGAVAEGDGPSTSRALFDAVMVRPPYGQYRRCGGACLRSGSLSWYCFERQVCHLECATAPPAMRCASH